MRDGEIQDVDKDAYNYQEPRSCIGVVEPGHYVGLLVEGRKSHSSGATLSQCAEILYNMGCTDAINLDGGNVVFSPSRETAIISDRVFMENRGDSPAGLVQELERLLEARVIIIPSLRSDMTGHADGMVRFVDEHTVIGNRTRYRFGLEMRIKATLHSHEIEVCDFPYFESKGDSAVGCYLNFLETEQALFLPIFGVQMDQEAIETAKELFGKTIVPVNINEIAKDGGVLNCISWEG